MLRIRYYITLNGLFAITVFFMLMKMELWDAAFSSMRKQLILVCSKNQSFNTAMQNPIIGCEFEPFSSTTHPQKSFSYYSPSCFLPTQIWK